jgi:hypothetical protein
MLRNWLGIALRKLAVAGVARSYAVFSNDQFRRGAVARS